MRLVIAGFSAVLLSGCAWMGGHSPYHGHTSQHSHQGYSGQYHGPQTPSRFHVEGSIGAEQFTGGNVLQNRVGILETTAKQEYKDVYKTGWGVTGGVSYDVAPRTTLIVQGFYNEADSKNDTLLVGTANGATPVSGTISDYKSFGAEIGFREYLNNYDGGLRPYISGTVGASYVEGIDLRGAQNVVTPIYNGNWVPTASGLVGVEMPISHRAALALESGLRYEGKRDAEILDGLADVRETYSVPIRLRGRYRF